MFNHKAMSVSIPKQYDYLEISNWLEKKGIELYGSHFQILPSDHHIIFSLTAYFLKDIQVCKQNGIDLAKGIMLAGPIGCGKTSIMTLMKFLAVAESKFLFKSCRNISFEFIQDGYEVIHKYSTGKPNISTAKIICFDDLGTENNLKYFGNECNVMAEILLSRYDLFTNKKLVTHLTTNLVASEIEANYGNRVRSRLREMVNIVAFDKSVGDKR